VAQKFHFAILRIEVTRASRGLSAISLAELLVHSAAIKGSYVSHHLVPNHAELTLIFRDTFLSILTVFYYTDDMFLLRPDHQTSRGLKIWTAQRYSS